MKKIILFIVAHSFSFFFGQSLDYNGDKSLEQKVSLLDVFEKEYISNIAEEKKRKKTFRNKYNHRNTYRKRK